MTKAHGMYGMYGMYSMYGMYGMPPGYQEILNKLLVFWIDEIIGFRKPELLTTNEAQTALPVLPALTSNQALLLVWLWNHYRVHRCFPTLRQAADGRGVSISQVNSCMNALKQKGYVVRISVTRRDLSLTHAAAEWVRINVGADQDENQNQMTFAIK
jgi:DNA-binding MarR family transcriptional regulator